eukprot:Mrub_03973.p1 GENE.Mrub_03973~~Mrub_03973.p1  ORF type:complete len:230 (+),score=57.74 Mrub_03973:588-1277(+)
MGVVDYQTAEVNEDIYELRLLKMAWASGKFILLHKLTPKLPRRTKDPDLLEFITILIMLADYMGFYASRGGAARERERLEAHKSIENSNHIAQHVTVFYLDTGGVGTNLGRPWSSSNRPGTEDRPAGHSPRSRIGQYKDGTVERLLPTTPASTRCPTAPPRSSGSTGGLATGAFAADGEKDKHQNKAEKAEKSCCGSAPIASSATKTARPRPRRRRTSSLKSCAANQHL